MNSKTKGNIAEAKVLAAFVANQETVLLPFGDNESYDLVIERNGIFVRVQVKTGRIKDNGTVIRFNTSSNSAYVHQNYHDKADVFAVYCPHNERIYIVPVDEVGTREASLRLSGGHNRAGIRYANNFEYPSLTKNT